MSGLIVPSRRRFFLGAGAVLAAPSIVRAASLMPVSVIEPEKWTYTARYYTEVMTVDVGLLCGLRPGDVITISAASPISVAHGGW